MTGAPPLDKTLSCSTAALSKPHYYYLFWQFCSLGSLCFSCIVAFVCTLTIVGPKCYSSVCRRWQEGKILCVPPALNNFVLVLPYHHQRKLLCQVPCGEEKKSLLISQIHIPALGWWVSSGSLLTQSLHLYFTFLSLTHTQSVTKDPSVSVFSHYWTKYNLMQISIIFTQND